MKKTLLHITLSCVALALPVIVTAQPDFSRATVVEDLKCFPDATDVRTYYYEPGKLAIATNDEDKPDFKFIQLRYTGTAAYGDQGNFRFRNILRFRVLMTQPEKQQLLAVKLALAKTQNRTTIDLRPMPIRNINTVLVFTPIDGSVSLPGDTTTLYGGNFSADGKQGVSQRGMYWKERDFSMRLDNESSQALAGAFEKGQLLMSVGYAFFSEGVNSITNDFQISGNKVFTEELQKKLSEAQDSLKVNEHCVMTDALAVHIDTEKWPDLVSQIDINEEIPPGYAALEIRCYDFNNNLDSTLYVKKIEVKATGVGGNNVITQVSFSRKTPDIYAQDIHFNYAVKMDEPFYYRITTVSDEGMPQKTGWIEQQSWTSLIDITGTTAQN